MDAIWDSLFPLEQPRIAQLFVEQVVVTLDGLDIRLRTNGLRGLVGELRGFAQEARERAERRAS